MSDKGFIYGCLILAVGIVFHGWYPAYEEKVARQAEADYRRTWIRDCVNTYQAWELLENALGGTSNTTPESDLTEACQTDFRNRSPLPNIHPAG